uniref:Uncharacterized protein n=1 Tax=Sphaerodactylus townsendi TaxID=933632 RepID=A0ACB8F0P8_9SAUR
MIPALEQAYQLRQTSANSPNLSDQEQGGITKVRTDVALSYQILDPATGNLVKSATSPDGKKLPRTLCQPDSGTQSSRFSA